MTENRSNRLKVDDNWGKKTIEITKNWLQRFRVEGGAKKRLTIGLFLKVDKRATTSVQNGSVFFFLFSFSLLELKPLNFKKKF